MQKETVLSGGCGHLPAASPCSGAVILLFKIIIVYQNIR